MTVLIDGFQDELTKLAGIVGVGKWFLKHPINRILLPAMIGAAGIAGMRGAQGNERRIMATADGPSPAWGTNYHTALGLPRRMSSLEEANKSINFPSWRAKQ